MGNVHPENVLMDDVCKKLLQDSHGRPFYCERVNQNIPPAFCHFKCAGDWRTCRKENIEELRKKYFKPPTEEEKQNKELISVIIPSRKEDEQYLDKTLKSLHDTCLWPIETIVYCDNFKPSKNGYYCTEKILHSDDYVGQRYAMNRMVEKAEGKYIFRMDAHCKMSDCWDVKLKASCKKNTLVTTIFDGLDSSSWSSTNRDNGFVRITPQLKSFFVRGWKHIEERETEEETMGISGSAWMILKEYYEELGGSDESLGEYGYIGSEWPLKIWLTGGRCVIRTDVVCYHLFRKAMPFNIDETARLGAYEKLHRQWVEGNDPRIKRPMGWLVSKFKYYLDRRVYSNF